jgi:hypothetical protein
LITLGGQQPHCNQHNAFIERITCALSYDASEQETDRQ